MHPSEQETTVTPTAPPLETPDAGAAADPAPVFVGLTTYSGDDQKREFYLPQEYVESVRRAGAVPLLIAPGERHLEALLARLDGLLLTGGGDLDPAHYHGRAHETVYMVSPQRDGMELTLARRALELAMPLFGICRGLQVINVALGGSLHEHLPDVVGETVMHRLPPREPVPHAVSVEAGTRLAGILGATEFSAASWHHQAVREPGAGLRVVARAPDGTVEALEHPAHERLLAVQWHPELTAARDSVQQRLFDAFVGMARAWAMAGGRRSAPAAGRGAEPGV
jgi:putative glutamine amidotransferase